MEIYALDQFEQIGQITTATRVEIIERDLGEGGWLIEMPLGAAGDIGAALISPATLWPGIEVHDSATGWRFGGYLTAWTIIVDEDGIETLRLVGSDFQADLGAYLEQPDDETPAGWWRNVVGGFIPRTSDLHNMVTIQAGPTLLDGTRHPIYGLVHGPDPAGGAPFPRRIKGEPLLAVCRMLLWGTPWTARLRLVRDTAGTPSMLFETPGRPVAPIVLDVKRGTFGRLELTTTAATVTRVVGMGAEIEPVVTPGERLVAYNSAAANGWQYRPRDLFINRPASDDVDALSAEVDGAAGAATAIPSVSAKVGQARVDGFGRDIDLGWLVDVHLGSTFTPSVVRLPVVASTLEFSPGGGWVRTADVGAESLSGPAAVYATVARTRYQLRQIEADIR